MPGKGTSGYCSFFTIPSPSSIRMTRLRLLSGNSCFNSAAQSRISRGIVFSLPVSHLVLGFSPSYLFSKVKRQGIFSGSSQIYLLVQESPAGYGAFQPHLVPAFRSGAIISCRLNAVSITGSLLISIPPVLFAFSLPEGVGGQQRRT